MADPRGWPANGQVRFSATLVYANGLTARRVQLAASDMQAPVFASEFARAPSTSVVIKKVIDAAHPAFGQNCLVSKRSVPVCFHLIDYVGVLHTSSAVSQTSDYVLALTPTLSIDAERIGNEARFINDYRGVASKPNADFRLYVQSTSRQLRMGVFAIRPISRNEEICVSYGKSFWKARGIEFNHA